MLDKIILGTVQLGLNYGINNSLGKPSVESALDILKTAHDRGIERLDTSDLYGESQNVITLSPYKKEFKVFSKFSLEKNHSIGFHLSQTLQVLGLEKLEGYSFHRVKDFLDYKDTGEGASLKKLGLFNSLGVSVYSNAELEAAIAAPFIDLIQVSFNLLDNAKMKNGLLEKAKQAGKTIHIRSVYLQGLFFKKPDELKGNLTPLKTNLRQIQELAEDYQLTMEELALGYVFHSQHIDAVLLGVETPEQLSRNLDVIQKLKFKNEILKKIEMIKIESPELLEPRNWRVA